MSVKQVASRALFLRNVGWVWATRRYIPEDLTLHNHRCLAPIFLFTSSPWLFLSVSQTPTELWDVEASTFSLYNLLIDGGKVVSLTRLPPFTPPGRFLVLISVTGWVDSRDIARVEVLGKLKKIHLIGNRTRDLPACIIVLACATTPT
jgi:hypothetical protein